MTHSSQKDCPACKGEGKVFSGYYGHPETSDGGPVMYICHHCAGRGKTRSDAEYNKIHRAITPDQDWGI